MLADETVDALKQRICKLPERRIVDCIDDLRWILDEIDRLVLNVRLEECDLRERVLREGYAWYMRDDGITPDTPLTDTLVALYEATEYERDNDWYEMSIMGITRARDRVTELLEGDICQNP